MKMPLNMLATLLAIGALIAGILISEAVKRATAPSEAAVIVHP